ncbi:MAG: hypothetical protein JO043_08085 [Candidatus Eremiobacteraeota bacterium]|nr:hypothetical protein [Candidatus Eremiobacteraeota bacterium]
MPKTADRAALAAQHVLRHLHDPAALSGNSLVSSLFGQPDGSIPLSQNAQSRLLALVRTCADQLRADSNEDPERRERQYSILVRCDLNQEPHDLVAAELALSRRQFYRERRNAAGYLARFLSSRKLGHPAHSGVSLDRFELELARAKSLRLAGEAQRSEAILHELIGSAEGIRRKVESWCALVDILINCNRIAEAEAELAEAQRALLNSNGASRSATASLQARLDMQRASYFWFQGLAKETSEIDARSERVIAEMSRSGSPDAQEFFVTTRLRQVQCELMSGTLERARADMEEIKAFLASSSDVPLAPRITFLIAFGNVKDHAPEGSDEVLSLLGDALALAQRHGLIELVIEAMCQLSSHAQLRGDHLAGMRYVYEVLPIAERFALPSQHGMLLNVAAISEASLGHHDAAMQLACRAREVLAPNSLEAIYSRLAEAQASVSTRGFSRAATAAAAAFEAAMRIHSDRLAGTALRLMGESAAGLGHREDARAFALGAVARLEREGPPFALLQAYQAAAKITGERRLRAQAAELAAALGR